MQKWFLLALLYFYLLHQYFASTPLAVLLGEFQSYTYRKAIFQTVTALTVSVEAVILWVDDYSSYLDARVYCLCSSFDQFFFWSLLCLLIRDGGHMYHAIRNIPSRTDSAIPSIRFQLPRYVSWDIPITFFSCCYRISFFFITLCTFPLFSKHIIPPGTPRLLHEHIIHSHIPKFLSMLFYNNLCLYQ